MDTTKEKILKHLCYTELVYNRINKKLNVCLSEDKLESMVAELVKKTPDEEIVLKGKNYYISDKKNGVRVTINSHTFRVITADRIEKY